MTRRAARPPPLDQELVDVLVAFSGQHVMRQLQLGYAATGREPKPSRRADGSVRCQFWWRAAGGSECQTVVMVRRRRRGGFSAVEELSCALPARANDTRDAFSGTAP